MNRDTWCAKKKGLTGAIISKLQDNFETDLTIYAKEH